MRIDSSELEEITDHFLTDLRVLSLYHYDMPEEDYMVWLTSSVVGPMLYDLYIVEPCGEFTMIAEGVEQDSILSTYSNYFLSL